MTDYIKQEKEKYDYELLDKNFYYDETSPSFLRWKIDKFAGRYHHTKNVSSGDVAGTLTSNGYYLIVLNRKKFMAHRIIWCLFNKEILSGFQLDHIDMNPLNNSIENLRIASKSENQCNKNKRSDNTSGVVGVTWDRRRGMWAARVTKNKKHHHVGYFLSVEEAATKVQIKRKELHYEFAR